MFLNFGRCFRPLAQSSSSHNVKIGLQEGSHYPQSLKNWSHEGLSKYKSLTTGEGDTSMVGKGLMAETDWCKTLRWLTPS